MTARILDAVKIVAHLADAILCNRLLQLHIVLALLIEQLHLEAAAHDAQLGGNGRDPDDAHAALGFARGSLLENGRAKLRTGKVAQAVGAELHLVALRRLGPLRGHHDAGIVEEHVEAVVLGGKGLGGGLDGGQVAEVEVQKRDFALGVGGLVLDVGDGVVCLGLGAAGQLDGAVGSVEDAGELLADAGVGAGDNVDLSTSAWLANLDLTCLGTFFAGQGGGAAHLAGQVTKVLLGKVRLAGEEVLLHHRRAEGAEVVHGDDDLGDLIGLRVWYPELSGFSFAERVEGQWRRKRRQRSVTKRGVDQVWLGRVQGSAAWCNSALIEGSCSVL